MRGFKHLTRNARELQIGHAYFMRAGQPLQTKEDLLAAFRDDVLPLLAEYCFENYGMLASILGHEIIDVSAQMPNETIMSDASRLHQALRRLVPASPDPPGDAEAMEEHNKRREPRGAAVIDANLGDETDLSK